jgi:hypothetical protein
VYFLSAELWAQYSFEETVNADIIWHPNALHPFAGDQWEGFCAGTIAFLQEFF